MTDAVEPLIVDLLEWIAAGDRSYAEVMDAWRTSCPRLPVWEEANARGLISRQWREGHGGMIGLTSAGRAVLRKRRRVDVSVTLPHFVPVT